MGLPVLAGAQPASAYDKGAIEVRPDPGFGQGTDWTAFIENEFNGLAVAPDGSVFLAQQRAHRIHKFDRAGRLIKSFGRQGQGPGDFNFPQHLSILDGKHLVVGENAEGRRISLFDLDGRVRQAHQDRSRAVRADGPPGRRRGVYREELSP